MELDAPPSPPYPVDVDFCSEVLSKFSNPNNERHLHICAAIGAMSQELKDQNLPLTAIAYFGATCSSLDRLLSSTADPPLHLVDSLLSILSIVIHRFNFPAVLESKYAYLSELVMKILLSKTVEVNVIVQALKLALPLLTLRHKVAWIDISQLYGVVVGYITDDRSQVRRCAAICISEVLQKFRSVTALAPMLAPASEAITSVFERFLLLAGGSNRNDPEQTKGAQEVLYVLDTLKTCLPFMSAISLNKILKHYKSLLEIRQTLVTKRITDALNNLCRCRIIEEVDGELLVDLLCSIATMLSTSESSADSMTFTVRLLGNGMKTVYLLDRQICVVKLPVIFSALTDVLTSGHEEALVEAVKTYIDLIHTCVDDKLIKQGVDLTTYNTATGKSGATVIEKLCVTTKSLLSYRYESIWNMSFQVVSAMFEKLGISSFYLFEGALSNLADIQKLRDEDFTFRKQLHECVGAALRAMGPESFLKCLPLNLKVQDMSEANLWLFPILKQYIVGANLRLFKDSVLPMIGAMKQKSIKLNHEGNMYSRSIDGIVYSLWSLLPSFCSYPTDTSKSFKGLEKELCTALREESDVRAVICSSLQILIQQNKKIVEGNENNMRNDVSDAEERAMALYTLDVATANLGALRSSAPELLDALSEVHFESSNDISGVIQKTIGDFASIAVKTVVSRLFRKTLQKLLEVTLEDAKSLNPEVSDPMKVDNLTQRGSLSTKRAQLFDLSVSLLPGLDSKEINLLREQIVLPALQEANGIIQKKAYRVLSLILQLSDDYTSRKLEDIRDLMIKVLPSCHISAKRHRLDCLYFLIIHGTKEGYKTRRHDITNSFLTEIILALKEANKKTRNRAYEILVHIGHAYEDDENGGEQGNLHQLFNMVAGGLAGETPHMISAAMKGLARLAYEFSDLVSAAYDILPSTFLLLQRENKEIIKANLGLLKVLVAKSQAEGLHTHLRSMVECLLNWQDSTRNHFRAKVKLLLEMLVNKCGLDAVKDVMPVEHMKLLTNIRKLKERKERNKADKSIESRSILSKATTSRMSKWNHTKIFSDIDDEETMHGAGESIGGRGISGRQNKFSSAQRLKRKRDTSKSLQEVLFDQSNDGPLDLLDGQRTSSALRSSGPRKKPESDDEAEMDSEGRLIIHAEGKKKADRKPKREMDDEAEVDGRSEAGSRLSRGSRKDLKRRKTSEAGWAYAGKEYASKKAAGDIKRKDKLEPYAYWPLDRKMVSRRPDHRASARKGMAQVVKMTKKLEGQSVQSALAIKGAMFKKGKGKGGKR